MKKQFLKIDCLQEALINSNFFDEAILLEEIDSSNDYAKKIIANNKNYRSGIIYANKQTKGRGRQNKTWISEAGLAMTFSLVFDSQDLVLPAFTSLIAAKALHQALLSYSEIKNSAQKLTIKWPNDIYAADKKIAGILTENIYHKDKLQKQILGIGLNFASENFQVADLKNAASIKSIYSFTPQLSDLFLKILASIEKTFIEENFDYDYINANSFLKGKKIRCMQNNLQVIGTANGINNRGELLLELEDQGIKKISSGSIELF